MAVDAQLLSTAQATRRELGFAMAAYIAWLADHYAELEEAVPRLFAQTRAAYEATGHRRIPEALAHLEVGALVAVRAFVDLGALSADAGRSLMGVIHDSLLALGEAQAAQVREANPAERFLSVLAELFAKKSVYCVGKHGDQPPACAEVGWLARETPGTTEEVVLGPRQGAERIGWADKDWLYLLPEDAPRLVARFLSDTDQSLGATNQSLFKALEDRGCIEVRKEEDGVRRTVPVLLEGVQRRVLKLRRDAVGGA